MDKGYQNSRELSLGGFNDLLKGRYGWMVFNKNDLVIEISWTKNSSTSFVYPKDFA